MAEKELATEPQPRYFRIKHPGQHSVYFAAIGQHEVPDPTRTYTEEDYQVQEAPWLFDEVGALATPAERVESVRIEDTTARPGARRGLAGRGRTVR